jgi:hypothetical protein
MNSDAPPSPSSESSAWDKRIDEAIQRFEAAMQTRAVEVQQACQKASDETSAAFKLLKEVVSEVHQKQVEKISSETSDHSDANKHTSEQVDSARTKPTLEASAAVLCSRCKVECGVPVSYEEFEKTLATPAKPFSELRSPPENFQPSSPKHIRSQLEVTKKIWESNLFARMKAVKRFRNQYKAISFTTPIKLSDDSSELSSD